MKKDIIKNFIIFVLCIFIGIQFIQNKRLQKAIDNQNNNELIACMQELDSMQDICTDAIADAIAHAQESILEQF